MGVLKLEDYNEKWQLTLETFKEIVSSVEYTTWFKSLNFIKVEDRNIFFMTLLLNV